MTSKIVKIINLMMSVFRAGLFIGFGNYHKSLGGCPKGSTGVQGELAFWGWGFNPSCIRVNDFNFTYRVVVFNALPVNNNIVAYAEFVEVIKRIGAT